MSDETAKPTAPAEESETPPARGPRLVAGVLVGLSVLGGSGGLAWYFFSNQDGLILLLKDQQKGTQI